MHISMHVSYFIFVHFRLFTVFDMGLAHYGSKPFNYCTDIAKYYREKQD